ncbi:MAG: sigma-54-dependent transcriptional regulator, partial [Gammaproteobacteria bacterium]
TAHGNMELAIRALKSGAFDFVSKPVDLQVLRNLVSSAIKLPSSSETIKTVSPHNKDLLGHSTIIEELRKKISKLARSQAPVFIHGESGSGKELAARLIHEQGARSEFSFVPVNCGAIPSELMESEFFGHKKGSFTGASSDKQGLFVAAHGGTLFLDEVADLPLNMQVKLLRAIQEKAIRPVGDQHEQPVDVRILSASHKNLTELVQQGKFREDLFYRINVIELNIPSLRQRTQDVPLLAHYLLARLAEKSALTAPPSVSSIALEALTHYSFPGNVRELENILERALALCEGNIIELGDLQLPRHRTSQATPDLIDASNPVFAGSTDLSLANNERTSIIQALEKTRWNKTAAAKLLGLTLRQLRYRLGKLNIE